VICNPVKLAQMELSQDDFWTAHFGGFYLFREMDHLAMISSSAKPDTDLPITYVFNITDQNGIANFLEHNALRDFVNWAEGEGQWPRITSDHPAYF